MGDVRRATRAFAADARDLSATETLTAYRAFRLFCLRTSLTLLKTADPPPRVLVSARLKRLRSILRKIKRGQSGSVAEMDDIIGFRVICESYAEALRFADRIGTTLGARIKNYLEEEHGAGLGYRAVHAIVRFAQPFRNKEFTVRFEIQVRSWYQHLWACWCESHGERAKEGFRNIDPYDRETRALKTELQHRATEIAEWESRNPDSKPEVLPRLVDPYSMALAWHVSEQQFGFERLGNNVPLAVRRLSQLESQTDIHPLLLVGVSETQRLRTLLRRTHPRFVSGGTLNPKYWMPR